MLSGPKGFSMSKIILGAFIYCMLRPQFSKIFTNENNFDLRRCISKTGATNSL